MTRSMLHATNELFSDENTFTFAVLGTLSSLRRLDALVEKRREAQVEALDATAHALVDALLGLYALRERLKAVVESLPAPVEAPPARPGSEAALGLSELLR